MNKRMREAAIFDMDGLLVDSEPIWMRAEKEVFSDFGLTLSDEMCIETRGFRIAQVVSHWIEKRGLRGDPAAIANTLEKRVGSLLRDYVKPMDGVEHAISLFLRNGMKIGIASSSPLSLIECVMDALDIRRHVTVAVSANDLLFGKPHPQVYMECADRLRVAHGNCIALEDTITGLISCKAAGMFGIAVPAPEVFTDSRYAIADLKIRSLAELTADVVRS